ncbi:MAG: Gmad2 immunoglobulin-like domain-containing protein [Minisyncoccota bacterium]
MNPRILNIIIVAVVVIGGASYFVFVRTAAAPAPHSFPQVPSTSTTTPLVLGDTFPKVTSSLYASTSPLVVLGEARGTWYFEASFPVLLLDGNGVEIAHAPAQAQGDWMTEGIVPFKAVLTFKMPTTTDGTLVLKKDNPSGISKNDAEVRVPIVFKK